MNGAEMRQYQGAFALAICSQLTVYIDFFPTNG